MNWIMAFCLHAVPDCLQPKHVCEGKKKYSQMIWMHSLASTGLMYVFGATLMQFLAALLFHVMIDTTKARWNWFRSMWLDQALHLITIYLIFGAGLAITPVVVLGLSMFMILGWAFRTSSVNRTESLAVARNAMKIVEEIKNDR